jgi:hypothetical protein
MAKVAAFPYIAAHINGVESFRVGEERVKEFSVGPGQPGTILLIVSFEPCEECPDAPTERRFMVPPAMVAFEVGPPEEMDVPDPVQKPDIIRASSLS